MKRRLEDPDSTNRIFENLPLLPAIRTLSLTRVSWKNITSPQGRETYPEYFNLLPSYPFVMLA
ncbi:hypothetical protein M422DRAFT_32040, partial [Sphaerobolus stellatus SS14]